MLGLQQGRREYVFGWEGGGSAVCVCVCEGGGGGGMKWVPFVRWLILVPHFLVVVIHIMRITCGL